MTVSSSELGKNINKVGEGVRYGNPAFISFSGKDDLAIVSTEEYNNLRKYQNNSEYLKMLDESDRQYHEGKVVVKTMAELEKMADG